MREGDYSIRARVDNPKEPLGEVMQQVNAMAATLRDQRLGALEATALLRKVMEEIEVAAFAFDPAAKLRLVNRAGERLLAQPAERLLARDATSLGLGRISVGEPEQTIQRSFPGGTGRWGIRRSQFREGGVPHQLLVVTDLTRPLREEELQAWQRLVRVLGHELNNSLTPIKSIAQSLEMLLKDRSAARRLGRRHVARLERDRDAVGIAEPLYELVCAAGEAAAAQVRPGGNQRAVAPRRAMETRMPVFFEECPPLTIQGDADQLEQALINLIRNAVDAAQETGGRCSFACTAR